MNVKYNMVVDFARPNKSNTILIAEDDANSRNCYFTLLADKEPFDMSDVTTATIRGILPTGAIFYGDAEIIQDEENNNTNVLFYVLPDAVSHFTGTTTLTVTLADSVGGRITSFEFYIKVRNALYNEDDYIDDDDLQGFRDLLNRTRAALERMEQMVQNDALPNPYPLRIIVDNVTYEYDGNDLVEVLFGEIAYLGPVSGDIEISADDSAAAIAIAAAEEATQAKNDTESMINNFTSLIPTATVTKNASTHQSVIRITDKNGTTTATVEDGVVGSEWYSGTDLTGKTTDITGYEGNEGDWYLNEATGNVYKCTQTGDISTALWDYVLTMGANNFGKIKFGSTIINASGDDTLEFEDGGVLTIVADPVTKKLSFSATGSGGGGGGGDMYKSEYGTTHNGVVKSAETLYGMTATVSELDYSQGVTSNIQTQLNGKAATSHTHTASQITDLVIPDELKDLAEDNEHKLVTATEKATWNGKQDALVEGTGIHIDPNTNEISVTAASAKGYKRVKVGSTNIDAGTAEDTLELVGSETVTITPDPVNKTLTFTAIGGGGGTGGDMYKLQYDGNNDGVVNSADTLLGLTASIAELNYSDGVTSNIQDQLDAKAASSHTHTKSQITDFPQVPTRLLDLSDLTGDTAHNLVSQSQIAAWNAKQNAITWGTGIQVDPNTGQVNVTGVSTLAGLDDTSISSPSNEQLIRYNGTSSKWENVSVTIPTVTDTYAAASHDGMSGVAVASAISNKANASDLDDWIQYSTADSNYQVVFDNLDDSYGYDLYADDVLAFVESMVKGTGTTSGTIKLTFTVKDNNDITTGSGSNATKFYLRILK